MTLAPIALFVYDRPDHLTRVVDALVGNEEASLSQLFIYSDAPKGVAAADSVAKVRSVARSVRGFRSVEVVVQPTNQGVAQSIIGGVSELVARFGKVIVLEDDLLPSRNFLRYMNGALDLYEDAEEVISIHGYSYPVSTLLPETFFLRGADCWGWATWKRAWDLFDPDGRKLLTELESRSLTWEFDFDGSYHYTQMLKDCLRGKNDSWAIRWYAAAFLRGKLTLYPGSSQIQNIGTDGSGVHVGATESFEHGVWGKPVDLAPIPSQESVAARRVFAAFLYGLRPPLGARILRRLQRLVSTQGS